MTITWLGRLAYYILPYRKDVIRKNLSVVYKQPLSKKEEKRFIQAVYSYYLTCIKTCFQLAYRFKKTISQGIQLQGKENLEVAYAKNKGVIILCGHLGSFQLASIWTHQFLKHLAPFHVVLKPISTKWIEDLFYRGFKNVGMRIISSHEGLKLIPKILKQNQCVFFAFDQHTKMNPKTAINVDFFGERASTYRSLATLVRLTKATVIPAHTYRVKNGQHVAQYLPELEWITANTKEEEIYLNTLNYNKSLEQMILKAPTQWFWTHRRWKLDPDFYKSHIPQETHE